MDTNPVDLTTDYLVVGAGMSGLAFVDELLTRTTASIIIVDKRDMAGGHWVDAYPFIKLHSPAIRYGVNSKELSAGREDEHGLNKGLLDLASGLEIKSYCHVLMRDRFLMSGRVTFLPLTAHQPDGTLRSLLTGEITTVKIKKRLVDASWQTNTIPLNHTPSFDVHNSVTCIPPNSLPRMAPHFGHYTVVGAGKTGIDVCLWLLAQGVDPERLCWIMPNDYWYLNRRKLQKTYKFFEESVKGAADTYYNLAAAKNASDFALRQEAAGIFMRLDTEIEPEQFHSAILSIPELEELRRINNVIRLGYLRSIQLGRLCFTHGELGVDPRTLYIDCSASFLSDSNPLVPVFQPDKIVLQLISYPLIALSSAKIAFLESLPMDDAKRNRYTQPLGVPKMLDGYLLSLMISIRNGAEEAAEPAIVQWNKTSRLHGSDMLANVRSDDVDKIALLADMNKALAAALENFKRLEASVISSRSARAKL